MKNIEVEIRSFITKPDYENLLDRLNREGALLDKIKEETVYFEAKNRDLRIRKNEEEAFLILKEGEIHDASREEIEIKLRVDDFHKIKDLLNKLGNKDSVRWFRKRIVFKWDDVKVFLDDTKGYGLILELEKIGNAKNKAKIYKYLEQKMKSLGVNTTPRKVFEKKFKYYKKNWRKILKYKRI